MTTKNAATENLSKKANAALLKYGVDVCRAAYHLNRVEGEGAASIASGHDLPGINSTRQADSAIDAFAEYLRLYPERENRAEVNAVAL